MKVQEEINYTRIAKAIDYINSHFRSQPDLEEIAAHVNMSAFHFQKIFTEWAGISPKKFLQYISAGHAKELLVKNRATLPEAAYETGLSGTGRLHDLFINIEGMTPATYKNGGRELSINFSFTMTPFGRVLVASTARGICYMAFEDEPEALQNLKAKFPNAHFKETTDELQQAALLLFTTNPARLPEIKLHLKGTPFQLKVWEALLKIPAGALTSYGEIARSIDAAGASRAVGTAIGSNPVAFLIPCHRVIQSTGIIGGYRWGATRKQAIIGWECAREGTLNHDE
jgi:AraC family transcriptional regulator of adaptative response/methylated-DNA-[protein]-cysteine methyltransferase